MSQILQGPLPAVTQSFSSPFQLNFNASFPAQHTSTDTSDRGASGQTAPSSAASLPLPDKRKTPSNPGVPVCDIRVGQGNFGEPPSLTGPGQIAPGLEWTSRKETKRDSGQAKDASPLEKSLAGNLAASSSPPDLETFREDMFA